MLRFQDFKAEGKFWEDNPPFYNFIQQVATGGFMIVVSKKLSRLNNSRVLDLGSGTSQLLDFLKPSNYLGLDKNKTYVEFARNKYMAKGKYNFQNKDVVKGKMPQKSFEYIISINILHHLADNDQEKFFRKASAVKAKEYVVVESYPNGFFGGILRFLDAGDNFQDFETIIDRVKRHFVIKKKEIVFAPFRTYKYIILTLKKLV